MILITKMKKLGYLNPKTKEFFYLELGNSKSNRELETLFKILTVRRLVKMGKPDEKPVIISMDEAKEKGYTLVPIHRSANDAKTVKPETNVWK